MKIEKVRNTDGTFVPKAEGVTAWKKDHMEKLYDAGILSKPPADVKEYGIAQSDAMKTAGWPWSDEFGSQFGKIMMKYQVPKEMAGELLQLHDNVIMGAHKVFSGEDEAGVAALRKEHGAAFDDRAEAANRLARVVFRSDGDHSPRAWPRLMVSGPLPTVFS